MSVMPCVDAAFAAYTFRDAGGAVRGDYTKGRLLINPESLSALAESAFSDIAFFLRRRQLAAWAALLEDENASDNDRFVLESLLRNAIVSAKGELALCQDTGTATALGWKDESVYTGADDRKAISAGAAAAYRLKYLRSSQLAPSSFFTEYDTLSNLPAQIDINASMDSPKGPRYRWLFVAKGGGSANKTAFFQMTKAFLKPESFEAFLEERVRALGVAACPPYRLSVVVGGSSPEQNLRVQKLAGAEILDSALPFDAGENIATDDPPPYRDLFWEERVRDLGRRCGLGAQFGGSALILDARVIRLSRHAASCFVSIGVSCSAHRCILASIDASGGQLERLETKPADFLRSLGGRAAALVGGKRSSSYGKVITSQTSHSDTPIDLNRPWDELRQLLSRLPLGGRVRLSGKLLVARDAAHARWRQAVAEGHPLPAYLSRYPLFYAGPAATPPGRPIGSLGPTTAQRMDEYADFLMARGAALITLAKGNRSALWAEACRKYGAFYLGTIGGAAALFTEENIRSAELIDFLDLGMEAVRLIEVKDVAAFVLINDRGEDFYAAIP